MDELDIKITPFVEDVFFVVLAMKGEISKEIGAKIMHRLDKKHSEQEWEDASDIVAKMLQNIEKYGYACNEWKNNQ